MTPIHHSIHHSVLGKQRFVPFEEDAIVKDSDGGKNTFAI